MLLAPQISIRKGTIKHIQIFLPTTEFTTHHSIACACASSQAQPLNQCESAWDSCHCQVRYEEERILLYLGLGILFLFANPWSSVQLYLGMKTVWYKSERKQINVVFSHNIFLLASFSDLKQTFSLSSLQGIDLLTCYPQMALW